MYLFLLFIVSFIGRTHATDIQNTCSANSGMWSNTTNSCFKHYDTVATWPGSYAKCVNAAPAKWRGRLAVISNVNALSATVRPSKNLTYWIGLKAHNKSKITRYAGKGTSFPYKHEWAFFEGDKVVAPLTWLPETDFRSHGTAEYGCIVLHDYTRFSSAPCGGDRWRICEFLPPAGEVKKYCSSTNGTWSPTTNSCFKQVEKSGTWSESYQNCISEAPKGIKSRLAVISSETVSNLIGSLGLKKRHGWSWWFGLKARNKPSLYKSGTNFPHSDQWAFFEGNIIVASFLWIPRRVYVDDYGVQCMYLNYQKNGSNTDLRHYSDKSCNEALPAVCEFQQISDEVVVTSPSTVLRTTAAVADHDDAGEENISDPTDFNPLNYVQFGESITVDVAPKFGLTGEAHFFTFKNQDQIPDVSIVARAAFDQVLGQAFDEAGESDLVGVSVDHPALEHEILIHFGGRNETTSEQVMQTIAAVQQSRREMNFDETMIVKVTRITPPEGRGHTRKLAKGRFEDFFKKHSGGHGSTFIEIKNQDWLCFPRAVVVAKARYQFRVLGDKTVPFNTIKRGDQSKCCKQRVLALDLMLKAGLLGQQKRACGIPEFKKIQRVIQKDGFQLKVFSYDHFDALIFDEEIPDLVPLYIYHHENHFTPMSSPKILTGSDFYCDLCNRGYNKLEQHKCPARRPCCRAQGRCADGKRTLCHLCNRRFKSRQCFDNHQKQPESFRKMKNYKRCKVFGQSICMKLKRCIECSRCVAKSSLAPEKHHCGMNYCSVCKVHWKIGEIHECFMQPIKEKIRSEKIEAELLPEECDSDADYLDNLIREGEERQGETDASRQQHFQKFNGKGVAKYLFWDFETIQCEQKIKNKSGDGDGNDVSVLEKKIVLDKKQYKMGPIYLHKPNYCIVRKACMLCKDFWLSQCENSTCKGHSCEKCQKEKPECVVCGEHYKSFSGESCKDDFCDYLFHEQNRGIRAIAHNAKGFDAQFIIQWLVANKRIPKIIPRGLSILSLEAMGIKVIDSFAFLPQSLESLPKTFNEPELKKGYFPYLFNRPENYNYVGAYPDADQYCPSQMKPEARQKFYVWYNKNKSGVFDFQQELREYTQSDVDILLRCCLKFNDLFFLQTGVYPLEVAITIAQACNHVFRKNYLTANTIGVIPTGGYRGKERQSLSALEWLRWVAHKTNNHIQHARNGREKRIGKYKVDGFIENENTVLEFNGCIFHGCRRCYKNRDGKPPNSNLTYEEAFQKTNEKAEFIKSQGYSLIQIWGCEWAEEKLNNPEIQDFLKTFRPFEVIDGRDALAGGRTNALVLWRKCNNGEKIYYYDVCSLYPYICKYGLFPILHPSVITENFQEITAGSNPYFGLIRCRVLPPRKLLHPVLPYRYNDRLNFSLCRTCVESENQEHCLHSEQERSFIGTFVSLELDKGLEVGYKVMEVYEVWHYEKVMKYDGPNEVSGLFTSYINKFLKLKQEKSGWPGWVKSDGDKQQYVEEYERKEGIKLDANEIEKNAGLRAIAKLMLNSFWGKFAQNNDMSSVEFFSEPKDFFDTVFNKENVISSVRSMGPNMVAVTYKKEQIHQIPNPNTSVVLASFVTAQARLKLYSYLEKLQERVLYFDTDSVIFSSSAKDQYMPETGDYLGDLTNELEAYGKDAYICEFVSCGSKQYSFKVKDPNTGRIVKRVTKVKGFSLNYANSAHINFDRMKKQVKDFVNSNGKNLNQTTIYQPQIKRLKTHDIVTETLRKVQKVVYCKRVVKPDYTSLPYGF